MTSKMFLEALNSEFYWEIDYQGINVWSC